MRLRLALLLALALLAPAAVLAAGSDADHMDHTDHMDTAATAAIDASQLPVVNFPQGARLEDLPGHAQLQPEGAVQSIDISLVAALVEGPTGAANGDALIRWANALYRNEANGEVHLFGPTIRTRAGSSIAVTLTNELVLGPQQGDAEEGYRSPFDTNLHTHGLHDSTGSPEQGVPAGKVQGDNIFLNIPARRNSSAPAVKQAYSFSVPEAHFPGLHWYHPHKHGSSFLQTITSSGLIIVEDHPRWLPDEAGCGDLRAALGAAQEVLLHIELFVFGPSNVAGTANLSDAAALYDDTNVQFYNQVVDPAQPLCCGGVNGTQDENSLPLTGLLAGQDFALINGGYQPVLGMVAGKWQRWRMVQAGVKRYLDMQIVKPGSTEVVADCELMLYAKDGVPMQQIPRAVNHIFVPAGARAELLVRCATPGQYVLTASPNPSPFGAGFTWKDQHLQDVVLTLDVAQAPAGEAADPDLDERACTPLRPSYAPDLRDANLEANGAMDKILRTNVSFANTGTNQTFGCLVNGKNFSMPDPEPFVFQLDKVTEWWWEGARPHPLHVHVAPYMIAALPPNCVGPPVNNNTFTNWFEEGDYHDILQMPMMAKPGPDNNQCAAVLRFQPGHFAGYSVMHCHYLNHEDMGCMKVVKFECPGVADPQPEVCPNVQFAVPGTLDGGSPGAAPIPAPASLPATPGPAPATPASPPPKSSASATVASILSTLFTATAVACLLAAIA